jgi:hypothetical protein
MARNLLSSVASVLVASVSTIKLVARNQASALDEVSSPLSFTVTVISGGILGGFWFAGKFAVSHQRVGPPFGS